MSNTPNKPKRLMIHCSVTPDSSDKEWFDDIKIWHMRDNRWSDIGYHQIIERNGAVKRGRPDEVQGAGAKGENKDTIHICWIGTHQMSQTQVISLLEVIDKYRAEYQIPIDKICGHYFFDKKKTCPNIPIEMLKALVFFHTHV